MSSLMLAGMATPYVRAQEFPATLRDGSSLSTIFPGNVRFAWPGKMSSQSTVKTDAISAHGIPLTVPTPSIVVAAILAEEPVRLERDHHPERSSTKARGPDPSPNVNGAPVERGHPR